MIHEDICQSPMATMAFVDSFLRDLEISSPAKKETRSSVQQARPPRWIQPPVEMCKMNVDGAVAKTQRRGAAGVVCRSHEGNFLGGSVAVFDGITHPGCLKALACREGFALASDLDIGAAVIASDCMEVVQGIHGKNLGLFSHILCEIRESALMREGIQFHHENRCSNGEAHRLARLATTLPVGRHVWLGTLPEGLNFPVNIVTV